MSSTASRVHVAWLNDADEQVTRTYDVWGFRFEPGWLILELLDGSDRRRLAWPAERVITAEEVWRGSYRELLMESDE